MTRARFFIWLLLLLAPFTMGVMAQNTAPLKGVVLDKGGEALVGAQVRWKDSKAAGAVVDAEGNFSIARQDDATTLVISYIGYWWSLATACRRSRR